MLLALLCLFLAPTPQGDTKPTSPGLLDRVVVMGASVSAGFGLCKELEVATPLSVLVDAALVDAPHETQNLGENLLFLGPIYTGHYLAQQALEAKPTLLIAVDYLFWYGMFWRWDSGEERLAGLERGLKELERFDCPIVIGDFPDVRPALKGRHEVTKGPVIFPSMIPSEPVRQAMNDRVRAWAAAHDNVVLVSLADFLQQLSQGEAVPLPEGQSLQGTIPEILQVDLLHPRLAGCQALVLTIFDAVRKAGWGLDPARVRWSMAAFHEAVEARTQAKREAALASRERRRERAGLR
ncbi:MAG: hypothetical protein H6829_05465 [Planctomycetes bacterium]|nr:hypothetical protein [Planctomycetota bacterium]